jgi:hypothetical protein
MIKHILLLILLSFTLLTLSACGGDSSSAGTQLTTYTTATLKINLNGDLGGKAIAGAGFTLTLPANVIPAMVNGAVATSVVTPSGTFAGGTQTPPIYIAATATAPGTVQITLANSVDAGVTTVGEVATVTLQLANGAAPVAANFVLNTVTVIDTLGAPVAGMTASVAGVTLQ